MIKKIFTFPLAIILALIIIKPYFHSGFPYTHDGENHLARFANYKIAVKEGQIPPRFAPNLMNHYGYPVFNYNYPLANILSLPFSFFKINYEVTFKIIAGLFVLLGLTGVYHWLDRLKLSYGSIMFGTAVYGLSPYIWSTVLFRGNIGEIMAWGLFPWLFYLVESLRSKNGWTFKFKGLIFAAFLISHNIAVLFGLPFVLIYAFLRNKTDGVFWTRMVFIMAVGFGLTLWFWLPAIAEKHLVNVGNVNLVNGFVDHFPTLKQLFFSPLTFGFSQLGKIDSMSFSIGFIQIILFVWGSVILIKSFLKKKINSPQKTLAIFIFTSLLLVIFQLKFTEIVWQLIPLASFIQFPWRLNLFLGVFWAGLGSIIWSFSKLNLKLFLISVWLIQLTLFLKSKPADFFHRNIVDYDAFSQSTSTNNENLPKNYLYKEIFDWKPGPSVLSGNADIQVDYWQGSKRQYNLTVHTPVTIVEPTMYFSGWQTTYFFQESNQKLSYVDDEQIQGRIGYQLETPGLYKIFTKFTQKTWPRIIGNAVSMLTLFITLSIFFKRFLKYDLSFYLSWKVFLLLVTLIAPLFLFYDPSFPYTRTLLKFSGLPKFIYSWANFDGVHYLTIVKKGYVGTGLIQAFFPLFPSIIRQINKIISNPILAGLIFNAVIGFFLLKSWKQIINREIDVSQNKWGIHILFLFPTALFLNAFYSEALFLWLVFSSFISARKANWVRSALFAAAASTTRVVGVFLIPALLVELWTQKVAEKKSKNEAECCGFTDFIKIYFKEIMIIFSGSLGLLIYMFYLKTNFNDPLYFFHVQSSFGGGRQESLVLYPQVVWRYLKILWTTRPFNLKYFAYVQEFIFGTLGLIAIVWSWFKVRKSYVVFSALVFLLPTLTGTFSSMPRYFLASFSVLLLMINILKDNKPARYIWLSISTLLLIFNTILFIQGYWVA